LPDSDKDRPTKWHPCQDLFLLGCNANRVYPARVARHVMLDQIESARRYSAVAVGLWKLLCQTDGCSCKTCANRWRKL